MFKKLICLVLALTLALTLSAAYAELYSYEITGKITVPETPAAGDAIPDIAMIRVYTPGHAPSTDDYLEISNEII